MSRGEFCVVCSNPSTIAFCCKPCKSLYCSRECSSKDENHDCAAIRIGKRKNQKNCYIRSVRARKEQSIAGCAIQHTVDNFRETDYMVDGSTELLPEHSSYLGKMTEQCPHCKALYFPGEATQGGRYNKCCRAGEVKIETDKEGTSPYIDELLLGLTTDAKVFTKSSNKINSRISPAQVHMSIDNLLTHGPPTLRVHNHVYSTVTNSPDFLRTFFYDTDHDPGYSATEKRILTNLQEVLIAHNPFFKAIKQVVTSNDDLEGYQLVFSDQLPDHPEIHPGTLNVPTQTTMIGMLYEDVLGSISKFREFTLKLSRTETVKIQSSNQYYDAACYSIYNINGEGTWYPGLRRSERCQKKITCLDYYGYLAHVRDPIDALHIEKDRRFYGGTVSLQYWVDMYMKIEEERLRFIRFNQSTLKASLYEMDRDDDTSPNVILPSSFEGSPRNFVSNYQDVMAIVAKYGKPTYFITFTCNPDWVEISENLKPGQKSWQRPDLLARVFKLKLKMLMKDLTEKGLMGKCAVHVEVVEFQKRGLPHAHILVIMMPQYIPASTTEFDKCIHAEAPIETNPVLREIITTKMIHTRCGEHSTSSRPAPCMVEGKCKRHYPKEYSDETTASDNDYYPQYRRRNTSEINRWVVPYNPYLSLKYGAHLNVEICVSYNSIKYLYKYVYKGPDMVSYALLKEKGKENDEILRFQAGRFLTPPEVFWRLFQFEISNNYPSVERLTIHDSTGTSTTSKLLGYFRMVEREKVSPPTKERVSQTGGVAAKHLLYTEMPLHYTWCPTKKDWKIRERYSQIPKLGRIYHVPRSCGETYFVRLLLLHRKNIASFVELRTVNGVIFESPEKACEALGLLANDNEIHFYFDELKQFQTAKQLRQSFYRILLNNPPVDPLSLWNKYKNEFSDDYRYRRQHNGEFSEVDYMDALTDINKDLLYASIGSKDNSSFGLPLPAKSVTDLDLYSDVDSVSFDELDAITQTMNAHQRAFYDAVCEALHNNEQKLLFLDGPGGTGKSTVFKLILKKLKFLSIPYLSVATSGIAATVINGFTAHSVFGIPLHCIEKTVSNVKVGTMKARMIQAAQVIMWDEVTMANKDQIDCVDRLCRDIMKDNRPFGGKVLILGGDWRQTLPVKQWGNRATVVDSLLSRCQLWKDVQKYRLVINERIRRNGNDKEFEDLLLSIGNGTLRTVDDDESYVPSLIGIPNDLVFDYSQDAKDFVNTVYPRLAVDLNHTSKACILTPKNVDVDIINDIAIDCKMGELFEKDSADICTDNTHITTEFLNKLTPSGIPPHKLRIKVGCPVILLRNIDAKEGLVNGARLIVKNVRRHSIECTFLTGDNEGKSVTLFRVDLIPDDKNLGFKMVRRQFPIRLAYAMTINKSQGQTVTDTVGIYLPNPVFTHGQLYVAMSRAIKRCNIRLLIHDIKGLQGKFDDAKVYTRNIVYHEVLQLT